MIPCITVVTTAGFPTFDGPRCSWISHTGAYARQIPTRGLPQRTGNPLVHHPVIHHLALGALGLPYWYTT